MNPQTNALRHGPERPLDTEAATAPRFLSRVLAPHVWPPRSFFMTPEERAPVKQLLRLVL